MLRVFTLYSGSSGNCTVIDVDGRVILIDAGCGVKKTQKALCTAGLSLDAAEGIFVTHEHSDHVAGLQTICKHFRIPVISNQATLDAFYRDNSTFDTSLFCVMPTGATAARDDFEVTSFRSPHDSAECVGYRITTKYGDVGVLTDAGEGTPEIKAALKGCKTLVFESNHDRNMLQTGPYPYYLKRRISGPNGHLSNDQSAEMLSDFADFGAKKIILAHLSKENNTPHVALSTAETFITAKGAVIGGDVDVYVAPPDDLSQIITFD
jgi:phosphoribosyl 1,2-cyclic phosphodiesterase